MTVPSDGAAGEKTQMSTDTQEPIAVFLESVQREREYQRAKWGDGHDDQHTSLEWLGLITEHAARFHGLIRDILECRSPDKAVALTVARHRLISVAALAFAADEAVERNLYQHPDPDPTREEGV
jgi:hypothetical protein